MVVALNSLSLFSLFWVKLLESFNYDNPNLWYIHYPQCQGLKQSPISIHTRKTITVNLPPIFFGYYDEILEDDITVHNKGQTAEFSIPPTIHGNRPFITGGLLTELYEVEAVHFHWGSAHHKGSEHLINKRRYDLEMHIVHKNVNYETLKEAREYEDGIAVIAVLFKSVKSSNVYYPGLNEIYNTLENIEQFNTTSSTQNSITLDSLFGNLNKEDFFTYRGSLTTPPCSEAVTWIVFSDIIPISYTVLPKFWQLLDQRGDFIENNHRPIQPLGYRDVYHRKPIINYEY